ncbi:MAG: autotransporter domain-containing protein, partial [Phenylobacterium sp.]
MKRLFVSAALLPLVYAGQAGAETKISTATTAPVSTATVAAGQPDDITIEAAGSIKPAAAGVAVTLNSNNKVANAGALTFNDLDNSTGILIEGGRTGTVTNSGVITLLEDFTPTDTDSDGDLDGLLAKGTNRFGIRATGTAPFTGDIINSGTITIEGNDSGAIRIEPRLTGNLTQSGIITVTGDRSTGVFANSVSGDVRVTGAVTAQGEGAVGVSLGNVDGGVRLQNSITTTGYRSTTRVADDATRAKLDADDLKQGGAAVRITGSVGKGVLLDRPPEDKDSANKDEDADGTEDALEGTASLTSAGSAPALDIGGATATTLGAVGTGESAFGLVNKGKVTADGVNDAIAAVGIRIGQAGGGTTTVAGGVNNALGTITAQAYGATAAALEINAGASVPALLNSGTIAAAQAGGLHDAFAVIDRSGTLAVVQNTGAIG